MNANIIVICLFLISTTISKDIADRPKEVIQKGNIDCLGKLETNLLKIDMGNDMIASSVDTGSISGTSLDIDKTTAFDFITTKIIPKNNDGILYINSFFKVKGQVSYNNVGTSFLQLSNIVLHDFKQWKLIDEYSLEEENRKFNGYIVLGHMDKLEITKTISLKNIRNIDHIKLELSFKFIASIWNGNIAYITIDDHLYWLDHHNWENTGCSNEIWNTPVKIIHKSHNNKLVIKFGIKLQEDKFSLLTKCPNLMESIDNNIINFENLLISVK